MSKLNPYAFKSLLLPNSWNKYNNWIEFCCCFGSILYTSIFWSLWDIWDLFLVVTIHVYQIVIGYWKVQQLKTPRISGVTSSCLWRWSTWRAIRCIKNSANRKCWSRSSPPRARKFRRPGIKMLVRSCGFVAYWSLYKRKYSYTHSSTFRHSFQISFIGNQC